MELQKFSQLIVDSWFILVLISFCNLLLVDLMSGSCVLLYIRLSLRFLVDEIQDGLTNRRFEVIVAVQFRCRCIDCLHEFVT